MQGIKRKPTDKPKQKPSPEKKPKEAENSDKFSKKIETNNFGKKPGNNKFSKDSKFGNKSGFQKNSKFGNSKFGSNNKHGQPEGKPQDWNEFKKKKKELQKKRKEVRPNYDVIVEAKKIGESLRVKTIEGEKKGEIVKKLHQILGKQGGYAKYVLTHDMARIVQQMLKYGTIEIREEISNDIIPCTVQMLQSKYGKFCVKRLLKYANHTIRQKCIKQMYGNAVKLASHAVSAPVFEYAYSTWATPNDKALLVQEFFGDMYKQTKDNAVKHLKDVYKDTNDMKAAALSATKANLARILNKDLLDSQMVQTVLWQFLTECNAEDRAELITQLAPHIVVISNSKDGARAAMQCIWHGTNKDRKVALKALKEHVLELCKHEHGHTMIIGLLDSIDDTVLLNKLIITDILTNAKDLVADDWGRKVLVWMVHPGEPLHFHPKFVVELEEGRQASNCKKDADLRRKEIFTHSSGILLKAITEEPKYWLDQASKAVTTLSILKSGSGEDLEIAMKAVCQQLVDTEWKMKLNEEEVLAVEHPGLHMALKKLAKHDEKLSQEGTTTFGKILHEYLTSDVVQEWINCNRGCFLLADIYGNNPPDVQKKFKKLLKKHITLLEKQKGAGAAILLKKIS